MGIARGMRFQVSFEDAFPKGLLLVGEVAADTEYQSREDRGSGRPVRQRVDEVSGLRQWKATVTDPSEPNAKRSSFEVTFLAEVQPVPTSAELMSGVRAVELDGLTAEPRVAGNGEYKYLSWTYRAMGFRAAGVGGGAQRRGSGSSETGSSTGKAA